MLPINKTTKKYYLRGLLREIRKVIKFKVENDYEYVWESKVIGYAVLSSSFIPPHGMLVCSISTKDSKRLLGL